jgi:hypothetical protein
MEIKTYIIAIRRQGRLTGLPLWTDWGEKRGYLPLILSLAKQVLEVAFEVAFCLSRYRLWDTRYCRTVYAV